MVVPVPDRREIRALNGKEGLIVSQGLLQDLAHVVRLRDEVTRDKTRLTVSAAALHLALPSGLFTPAGLNAAVPPLAADRIVTLAP